MLPVVHWKARLGIMIQHACTEVLGSNCLDSCLPEHYLPTSIYDLIQNDTEKANYGGITKARDIDCQGKGRLISLALMIEEFSGLSLRCKRLLHIVFESLSQEFNTSCQILGEGYTS